MAEPVVVKLVRPAMATTFEVMLWGEDSGYLRSVAEEALDEIERIERQISIFLPQSDISEINARAYEEPVRVEAGIFRLLKRAAEIGAETGGAFDITTGPLSKCWGFQGGEKRIPTDEEIQTALDRVGMDNILFGEGDRTVRFKRKGISIDLGGIGKGCAIERAAEIIRGYDVPGGLIHGGTSTICAIGAPPDRDAWPIGILNPLDSPARLGVAHLRDQALSTSRSGGKFFEVGGRRYGHILDPCTGFPAEGPLCAAALGPSPADSDALSTAFAILDLEETRRYCEAHPGIGAIVVPDAQDGAPRMEICGVAAEEALKRCLTGVR